MQDLPFKKSKAGSIGIELELQLINKESRQLASSAQELLNRVKGTSFEKQIKPEITQGMIEINSSIQESPTALFEELKTIQILLYEMAKPLEVTFCGGGIHPFEQWSDQLIFPELRYQKFFKRYGFLCQQATVFGQHIHLGCQSAEDALYLTHAFARFMPQLIALSASSPFYQGRDSGFHSARNTIFNSFPTSGYMPMLQNWNDFKDFFFKMKKGNILETMKDIHWDIRPKPEFGTVEIRICDTPLSLRKAILIAVYIQVLSRYLLDKKPIKPSKEFYYTYTYNRFLASRYGMEGEFVNPVTFQRESIGDDLLGTLSDISNYMTDELTRTLLSEVSEQAEKKDSDAQYLRSIYQQSQSYPLVVAEQCRLWKESIENQL